MDLVDQIEQVHPKVTYDGTQVIRSVKNSESGEDSNSDSDGDSNSDSDGDSNSDSHSDSDIDLGTAKESEDGQTLQERIAAVRNRINAKDLPQTQVINNDRLPQLEIDESEIGVTQKVTSHEETTNIPNNEDSETVTEPQTLSLEEKTKRLIEQRRNQRELNRQEMEHDISNVTLTDEENDEYNESVLSTENLPKNSDKDLSEAQKFIDNQKREQFFDHIKKGTGSGPKKKFSAASFVNAFTEEFSKPSGPTHSNSSNEDENDNEDNKRISSPVTSPIAENSASSNQNPIELYKQNLKQFNEIDLDNEDVEIPSLTKDLKLSIKQKFLRANISKFSKHLKQGNLDARGHHYLKKLFNLNINQLSANPNRNPEDLEEEKNEEIMGSLLEREIERARNIRKQEKLRQQAKMALLGKSKSTNDSEDDDDYDGQGSGWDESEVPNSEFSGDEENSEKENDSGAENTGEDLSMDEDEQLNGIGIRRKGKVVDSESDEDADDNKVLQIGYNHELSFQNSLLFQNLAPLEKSGHEDHEDTFEEIPVSQLNNQSFTLDFNDSTKQSQLGTQSTQLDQTQVDKSTQLDETQVDQFTQVDRSTQVVKAIPETQADEDEHDLDITPEAVSIGKRAIQQNQAAGDEDEDSEETEEQVQERIRQYEAKIRKKELRLLQRRKEMERKGYNKIIEGEAEESEDEWAGLGGKDGEFDEDRPDSEDERMIDNNLNIDLNNDEIRKKFMEQYQIKDKKELEKLVDDIKNHKLVKRSNGLDIELSDEEDEILQNYRKQKLKEQRLKLQQMDMSLSKYKTDKSKAFFDTIQDDINNNSLRISIDDEEDVEEQETQETKEDQEDQDDDSGNDKSLKSLKIGEDFIRQKLSFLNESVNEYELEQKKSNYQYNVSDSEEEDLHSLKMKSITNLRKRPIEEVEIETDNDQEPEDSNNDKENKSDWDGDDFDDDLLPARKPSMVKSFRSSQSSTSSTFSGVTVSKQYKTASGSKASITFMSKQKKPKLSKLQASRKFTPKTSKLHQ